MTPASGTFPFLFLFFTSDGSDAVTRFEGNTAHTMAGTPNHHTYEPQKDRHVSFSNLHTVIPFTPMIQSNIFISVQFNKSNVLHKELLSFL